VSAQPQDTVAKVSAEGADADARPTVYIYRTLRGRRVIFLVGRTGVDSVVGEVPAELAAATTKELSDYVSGLGYQLLYQIGTPLEREAPKWDKNFE